MNLRIVTGVVWCFQLGSSFNVGVGVGGVGWGGGKECD